MSALRELIAFFSIEVDGTKKLDQAGEKMKGLADTAMKAAGMLGIAFGIHEISEFITKQIEVGNEALNTAEMLGVSVVALKEFRYAAYQADVGAEEADTALRFLNKNMGEAAQGAGTAAQTFARLGVKMKDQAGKTRPAIEVMGDLADGIANLHDPAKETATAMELFGRAGAKLIPLLHKGSKGIAELSKEFQELNEGAAGPSAEVLEEAEHQQKRLETASKGLKAVLSAELIPAFTAIVHWVTDLVKGFREFAGHSYIVQSALGTLAGVAVVLAVIWGVLNIEILLVVAAIALAILVIDDIYTAMQGGKSVFGDWVDAAYGLGTTKKLFENVRAWADDAYLAIRQMVNGIQIGINGIKKAYNEVKHVVKYAFTGRGESEYEAKKKELDEGMMPLLDKHDNLAQEERNNDLHAKDRKDNNARPYEPSFDVSAPRWDPENVKKYTAGASPPATITAPGASSAVHNVTKNTEVHVTNNGLKDPAASGAATLESVRKAIDEGDNQASFAALPGGGGH